MKTHQGPITYMNLNRSSAALIIAHISKRVELTETEKADLIASFSTRRLLARQYLLQQGETCKYEYYVCEGFLRSFVVDETGQEHTLHFAMEDWWITDLDSLLNQRPSPRNIIAVEQTTVLQLDLEARDRLIQKSPVFDSFWRILNEQACIAADKRILDNISLTGAQRYEALLKKYPGIEQRLSQKHIASYLGITPVFLSQIRKELLKK